MRSLAASARVAVVLAALCVLLPLAAWLPAQPAPQRQAGGWMTLAVAAFLGWTALSRRRVPAAPASFWIAGAALLSLIPLLGLPWEQVQGGLADRMPLLSAWLLFGAARAWRGLAQPVLRVLAGAAALLLLLAVVRAAGLWPSLGTPAAPFASASGSAALLLTVVLAGTGARGTLPTRAAALLLLATGAWCGWLGLTAARLALPLGIAAAWWRGAVPRGVAALAVAAFAAGELTRALLGGIPADTAEPGHGARTAVHLAAAERAWQAPQGIGLGRFSADYPGWRPPAEGLASLASSAPHAGAPPSSPADDLLLALLEFGWGGVLLLLAAAAIVAHRLTGIRLASGADDPIPMLLGLGGFALTAAPFSGEPAVLAAGALLTGLMWPAAERTPAASRRQQAATAALLLLAVAAALPARAQIRGERAMASALDPQQEDPAGQLAVAVELRPWDAQAWFLLGDIARQLEVWERARELYARTLRIDPFHLGSLTGVWYVEMVDLQGDRARGFKMLERAEALAPWHPTVQDARPQWLRAIRDRHLETARAFLSQGRERARTLTCSVYLVEARLALLDGQLDDARGKLNQAAAFVDGSDRLRLERLARAQTLDEPTVAAITLRLWPAWPDI